MAQIKRLKSKPVQIGTIQHFSYADNSSKGKYGSPLKNESLVVVFSGMEVFCMDFYRAVVSKRCFGKTALFQSSGTKQTLKHVVDLKLLIHSSH
ncbi:MAG: hypothetical protein AAFO06_15420 [Cyanobacteria bacterium J06597_16]